MRGKAGSIGLVVIVLLLLPVCSCITPAFPQDQPEAYPDQPEVKADQPEVKTGALIQFTTDELVSPVWVANTSGGATWEVDTSQYVEGTSSLKITLPKGSAFEARSNIYNLPAYTCWDLSRQYFKWAGQFRFM